MAIITDVSMASGWTTTRVAPFTRLLRDRKIPASMPVGDEKENPEFEARDIKIVELECARPLDRGLCSAAVERRWNLSASSPVERWIEANDTPQTVYHIKVFSQILSSSIFKVLRRVAGRTAIHAQDFFHACANGAFMDYKRNEICRRTSLGMSCLTTNCDRRSDPQKLWRAERQVAPNCAMSSNLPRAKLILLHEKMAPFFNLAGFANETIAVVRDPAEASSSRFPVILTNQPLLAEEIVENELGVTRDTRDVVVFAGVVSTFAEMPRNLSLAISRYAFKGVKKIANTEQEWANDLPSIFKALVGRQSALCEVNVAYVNQI